MDLKLLIASDGTAPLSVLAVAGLAAVSLTVEPSLASASQPVLVLTNGTKLRGTNVLLRYLGRIATTIPTLYKRDDIETSQIDEWLDYAPIFSSGSEYEGACKLVDGYLLQHTFLVGHSLSVADISIWSYLAAAGKRWESLMKSKRFQSLTRWYNMILSEHATVLNDLTSLYTKKKDSGKLVPSKSNENGKQGSKEVLKASNQPEVDLPDAEIGKVVLRFAPEPSGYLHIGHAKAALMNKYFAEKYKGKLIIRFDDTNPAKESNEFVDNLLIDIKTLGINYEKVTYTSDYFPQLMEMAVKLIKEGKAYVDDTPREQMQKERMDGIDSKCRNNTVDENIKLWEEMKAGSQRGLQCCVRGKLDMQDPNKSLRDPVYYRCNPIPHHRIGSEYKIYPTYDFACPFVDSIEGITHALRSSEYHDRNAQYFRIQEDMGLRKVHIYEFSRLNLVYTLLSKRKLLWFVENGKVDGWDDARFPTVQGIVRRGLQVEALIQFILEQGASKNLNLMEWDKLWNINKKIIDPVCPRHTAIVEEGRVLLTLTDGPETPFVRMIPKHKKFQGAGEKATTFTKKIWIEQADAKAIEQAVAKAIAEKKPPTVEVTLMDWGNAIVEEIKKDSDGNVTELIGKLHLEGSVKATQLKLTWLPEINELAPLTLVEFGYLITKKKLDEDEDFIDVLNPDTKKEIAAVGDANMKNLKRGDILQLERKGYFRCDVPFIRPTKPIVLYAIPDGKQTAPPK
ncbi:Aminoacyl-tRNA synthetase, class I, conserved site-containing protein [Artemisia annua]|uniref:glutamate--tRNA ligase n=1 Tax=Artemisia annua TaxID=35608 RepID=A0A2U1M314_ARTAN|nr:Aminoacyl-tRNA synthetase, class I, conserved site-containing protein [Artemisia annua]